MSRRLAGEAGSSLAEILVALSILGIAVASIVGGLATVAKASDYHRKQATADTVARSYAEALKQRMLLGAYRPCTGAAPVVPPAAYDLPASFWGPPAGYSVRIASVVQYWQGSGSAFSGTCPVPGDQGAQLLHLEASSDDGRDTQSLSVIVRVP